MDLESLFFAFYYQCGTYQQYLAAIELKKRGWQFHNRFQTWIKKEITQELTRGGKQQTKTKTIFFDYEKEWKCKVSAANEIQIDDPAISKYIENEVTMPPLPIPCEAAQEAIENLNQECFEQQFLIGSIRVGELSKDVLDQLCK